MRIESEIKLDYKDVLLRPKRSELTSRKEVDLMRTFTFKNAGADGAGNPSYGWTGVPIVAANMDTVGTFETAKSLADYHMLTCISKHYDSKQWMHKMNGYGIYVWSSFVFTLGSFGILYSIVKSQLVKEQKKFEIKFENLAHEKIEIAKKQETYREILTNTSAYKI